MKLRHALRSLVFSACLLSAAEGFGRGGETGTLDQVPGPGISMTEAPRLPVDGKWAPYYLKLDRFRRLRARLDAAVGTYVPVPGWEDQRAWRFNGRYFTYDGVYELFPLVTETIR